MHILRPTGRSSFASCPGVIPPPPQCTRSGSSCSGVTCTHHRVLRPVASCMGSCALVLQVPRVVAEAKQALEQGYCVVIGLQSTGAAQAQLLTGIDLVQHNLCCSSRSICCSSRSMSACQTVYPVAGRKLVSKCPCTVHLWRLHMLINL